MLLWASTKSSSVGFAGEGFVFGDGQIKETFGVAHLHHRDVQHHFAHIFGSGDVGGHIRRGRVFAEPFPPVLGFLGAVVEELSETQAAHVSNVSRREHVGRR